MSSSKNWRLELAKDVAGIYACDPRVIAVTIGGSVALGTDDSHSDIDIYAFCNQLPSHQDFMRWAQQVGGDRCKSYDGEAAIWGHFYIGSLMIDAKFTLRLAFEEALRQIIDQHDIDEQKHFSVGGLLSSKPIYGEVLIQRWQQKAATYPEELARALVKRHLWFGPHWYVGDMLQYRGELLLVYECFHRWTKSIVGILAALNRQYDRGELKGVQRFLDGLKIKPQSVSSRLRMCFEVEPVLGLSEFYRLIVEVFDLVKEHMPDIDTSEARRVFTHPRVICETPPTRVVPEAS